MKRIVIIPTFNEVSNIKDLMEKIHAVVSDAYIVVVDDNSPDKTSNVVNECAKKNPRISLLSQNKKNGLGQAYLHGFNHVLNDPDVGTIAMMDADFSHNPECLPAMFEALSQYDVVIGSRYVRGGKTIGWELWRRLLSFFANLYCKIILRMRVWDATSGFYAIRAETLRHGDFSSIDVSGYAFQIEFKYLLWKQGNRLKELPIVFTNRVGGESKISGHIISEGIMAPWKMLFK